MNGDDVQHFTVLLEQIRDHVGLIADGHKALNEKVDTMAGELAEAREDIAGVKLDVSVLKRDVSALKVDVGGLKLDVHAVKDHLGLNGTTRPKRTPPAKRRPAKK